MLCRHTPFIKSTDTALQPSRIFTIIHFNVAFILHDRSNKTSSTAERGSPSLPLHFLVAVNELQVLPECKCITLQLLQSSLGE